MKSKRVYYIGRLVYSDGSNNPAYELVGEGIQPVHFTNQREAIGALTFLKQRSLEFAEFSVISGKVVTP